MNSDSLIQSVHDEHSFRPSGLWLPVNGSTTEFWFSQFSEDNSKPVGLWLPENGSDTRFHYRPLGTSSTFTAFPTVMKSTLILP